MAEQTLIPLSVLRSGTFPALAKITAEQGIFAQGPVIDITHPDYGAVGDARWVTDASINAGKSVLSSASANFTSSDVGKAMLVAGAGAGGALLSSKITSVQGTGEASLADAAGTTVANVNACIGTDNAVAIQKAINYQQLNGGHLRVPDGHYLTVAHPLVPAPGSAGNFTASTRPLLISGDGMRTSVLVAGQGFGYVGLLGYGTSGVNPVIGQVVARDLTLDGNYAGVGGGVIPQPASGAGALVSLDWPGLSAATNAWNGRYHIFDHVRFYRPTAYVFQPSQGIVASFCEFDSPGQPDLASGSTHYDNLGSGQGDAIVLGCYWHDGSGNYADFVDSAGGAGHIIRLVMVGCVSKNHQIGGIYACGLGSIIVGNRLHNNVAGSGIGYDATTAASLRSDNMVALNVLDNLEVNVSGLSDATNGDVVFGNTSPDAPAGINAMWQGGLLFGLGVQSIPYAASITPDFTKGQFVKVGTLTGNLTINTPATNFPGPANSLVGQIIIFQFTQDVTGGRSVSWAGQFKNPPAHTPPDANATSYVAFVSDGASFWSITPFPIDQSSHVYGADTVFEGGIRFVSGTSNFFTPPRITSPDGISIHIEANTGNIFLTPGANSEANGLVGLSSGNWSTIDGSQTVRNVLDDGSGHMGARLQIYPGAEAGATQTSGGFLHSTGVPSNANGNNNDFCISDNNNIYVRVGGVWSPAAWPSNTQQSQPANPTGTASTTGVMMGLAVAFTPKATGKVKIVISGDIFNATAIADGGSVQIRHGTGTAPANAAALTGTADGGQPNYIAATTAEKAPFALNAIVSGLSVGVAIWVDLALAAITGGTAAVENLSVSIEEV